MEIKPVFRVVIVLFGLILAVIGAIMNDCSAQGWSAALALAGIVQLIPAIMLDSPVFYVSSFTIFWNLSPSFVTSSPDNCEADKLMLSGYVFAWLATIPLKKPELKKGLALVPFLLSLVFFFISACLFFDVDSNDMGWHQMIAITVVLCCFILDTPTVTWLTVVVNAVYEVWALQVGVVASTEKTEAACAFWWLGAVCALVYVFMDKLDGGVSGPKIASPMGIIPFVVLAVLAIIGAILARDISKSTDRICATAILAIIVLIIANMGVFEGDKKNGMMVISAAWSLWVSSLIFSSGVYKCKQDMYGKDVFGNDLDVAEEAAGLLIVGASVWAAWIWVAKDKFSSVPGALKSGPQNILAAVLFIVLLVAILIAWIEEDKYPSGTPHLNGSQAVLRATFSEFAMALVFFATMLFELDYHAVIHTTFFLITTIARVARVQVDSPTIDTSAYEASAYLAFFVLVTYIVLLVIKVHKGVNGSGGSNEVTKTTGAVPA